MKILVKKVIKEELKDSSSCLFFVYYSGVGYTPRRYNFFLVIGVKGKKNSYFM